MIHNKSYKTDSKLAVNEKKYKIRLVENTYQ